MPDLDFLIEIDPELKILIPSEYFELIDATNICYEIKIGSKDIRLFPTDIEQPISTYGEDGQLSYLTIDEQGGKVIESSYVRMTNWSSGKKLELQVGKSKSE